MNNIGMTFGMEGPMITGWWVNPKTGDKFNAVDSFFEDNQLLIKTSDGRLIKYSQIQDYVQTKDSKDMNIISSKAVKKNEETIPAEVLNELEAGGEMKEDDIIIPDDNIYSNQPAETKPLGNIYNPTPAPQPLKPNIKDFEIIDRALKNNTIGIKCDLDWSDFPKSEINLLNKIMNVSIDDIVDYYMTKVDTLDIVNSLKDILKEYILKKMNENVITHEVVTPVESNELSSKDKKEKKTPIIVKQTNKSKKK